MESRNSFSISVSVNKIAVITIFVLSLLYLAVSLPAVYAVGSTYYVNNKAGSNCSNGAAGTSQSQPWCDFTNVNTTTFQPGDQILLARGAVWDQAMRPSGSGTSANYITLGAYGSGANPAIDRGHNSVNDQTINMTNPSYWIFENLEIRNAAMGIHIIANQLGNQGLIFRDLYFHDIDLILKGVPTNIIGVWNSVSIALDGGPEPSPSEWLWKDIEITRVRTLNAGGFVITANDGYPATSIQNVTIHDNDLDAIPSSMLALAENSNVKVFSNKINSCAQLYQSQGTTCVFLWRGQNITFANNMFTVVTNTGSHDMSFIDHEFYDDQVRLYSNYFADAAGPAIEYLALSGSDRGGDISTNHIVKGNVFAGNSTSGSSTLKGSLYRYTQTAASFTGTASDNLYYEPTGFTNNSGLFTNWTLTNNTSISVETNIYNSSNGFSATQGANRWYYELYNGSSYSNLSYDSTNAYWGTSTGYVSRFNIISNNTSSNWVSRTWNAPNTGTISIRGRALKNDIAGGDGVKIRITKNGTVIYPVGGGAQAITATDQSGVDTNLDSISISSGDMIRFEINNGGSANSANDLTSWAPSVAYTSTTSDTTAPAAVTNLAVGTTTVSTAPLTWTSPGDDASTGTASSYDIRYSTSAITAANWSSATQATGEPSPSAAGTSQNFTVTGLNPGTTFYFAIKTLDEVPNTSVISNVPNKTTSPSSNLLLSNPGFESGLTSWTAQNSSIAVDTGNVHSGSQAVRIYNRTQSYSAAKQDIKSILLANGQGNYTASAWAKFSSGSGNAFLVINTVDSGGSHWFTTDSISVGTSYTQFSGTLNITWTGTLSSAVIYTQTSSSLTDMYEDDFSLVFTSSDTTAPSAITNLAVGTTTLSTVPLSWTSPGDDGSTGTASSYDIRYSTSAITTGNWASATQATGEPTPSIAGTSESFTVNGLNSGTTYYFAIKTSDEMPNESGLSNLPNGTTSPSDNLLLSNPGFESGLTSWSAQTSSIAVDTGNVNSGSQAVRIYNRTAVYSSVKQDIKSILLANGQGNYSASAWSKFSSGSNNVLIVVNTVDSGGSHWFETTWTSVGTSYTQLSGTLNITWTGTLSSALIYTSTSTALTDMYQDDFSLVFASSDTTAPSVITNFAVGTTTASTAPLTWTSPGDDGSSGAATTYDIRYSTSTITSGNWASATQAVGEPVPAVAGTSESFTVTDLNPSTTYYFAIKTKDEMSNESGLSNVTNGTTTSGMDSTIVGEWKFNETSGTSADDTSANSNIGTLTNGAVFATGGKSGYAVSLDGTNDYVNIADNAALDGMSALTVSAWVNLTQMAALGYIPVGKDWGGESYRIFINAAGTVQFVVRTTNNSWYSAGTAAVSPSALTAGTWYHLVGTYDGANVKIYINGVYQATGSQTISGSIYNTGAALRIGYLDLSNYTKGKVDEVRIYNRALNASEVLSLYNSY
ncbi:hypothetical protein EHS13_05110 [Paenibacillus psychroresistens]|uniref:Fibronectin type-III domain-containing protein n=1 Tax=Paenibacillus psychroresistens TaxID=1778678 RepID=A0A6B8RFX9_9BACL|nr:LamG-like jellyroll fold domain-containing protein [Paenibacillus psychroresistens]QGQ94328.1 hypothetical protein EHS13_05110 [Paenibacillus psychroresistens]